MPALVVASAFTRRDCMVVKGFDRVKFDPIGSRDSTNRFTVFYLVAPTVALLTAHFLDYKFTTSGLRPDLRVSKSNVLGQMQSQSCVLGPIQRCWVQPRHLGSGQPI
ncbi:hypothetical protein Ddc_14195 [Ditylenchus destructor]|nr:hypothetical protein Ddc_14195 [Ditylenchus destructor]